jgi:YVTN family beta-propeller protein
MTDFPHPSSPWRAVATQLWFAGPVRRALRVALWTVPLMALAIWLSGLPIWPADAVKSGYGLLCSAAAAIVRVTQTAVAPHPPLRMTAAAAAIVPPPPLPVQTVPGMAPVLNPANLYSAAGPNMLSAAVAGALPRVYVPNLRSGDVYVIDPATRRVVDRFPVGVIPQHVVPAFDLQTLWVANNGRRRAEGSLTPIDPKTGRPGPSIPVTDPYNMYFTPDGRSAIVVAERLKRLDFRDPHTMALQQSLSTPGCSGINHADFSIDGRYAIFTCEFRGGGLVKVDMVERKVVGYLRLDARGMLQDIRISPDGKVFYVADMLADGVFVVDGDNFTRVGFIPTGVGTHGLYPSRDGTKLYVTNRGSHKVHGPPYGPGSISVLDFATRTIEKTWPIRGGGSPDMGNVSADGRSLWLSGRYDNVVYDIDTTTGAVIEIPVGREPHGLTVWPQPGRYSLGHTGNMR